MKSRSKNKGKTAREQESKNEKARARDLEMEMEMKSMRRKDTEKGTNSRGEKKHTHSMGHGSLQPKQKEHGPSFSLPALCSVKDDENCRPKSKKITLVAVCTLPFTWQRERER